MWPSCLRLCSPKYTGLAFYSFVIQMTHLVSSSRFLSYCIHKHFQGYRFRPIPPSPFPAGILGANFLVQHGTGSRLQHCPCFTGFHVLKTFTHFVKLTIFSRVQEIIRKFWIRSRYSKTAKFAVLVWFSAFTPPLILEGIQQCANRIKTGSVRLLLLGKCCMWAELPGTCRV